MTPEEVYEEAKRRYRELNKWLHENGIFYCVVLIQKRGEDKAQSSCAIHSNSGWPSTSSWT